MAALELAVLIGLQASGKSTFCDQMLAGSHVVVSKDHFPKARHRQRRQMRLVTEALAAGHSVAVDNTNPSPQEWRPLVAAAQAHGATTVAYWFVPDLAAAMARNAARDAAARVPDVGLYATVKRLRQPGPADGFDRRYAVRFDGAGGFRITPLTGDEGCGTTTSKHGSAPARCTTP